MFLAARSLCMNPMDDGSSYQDRSAGRTGEIGPGVEASGSSPVLH